MHLELEETFSVANLEVGYLYKMEWSMEMELGGLCYLSTNLWQIPALRDARFKLHMSVYDALWSTDSDTGHDMRYGIFQKNMTWYDTFNYIYNNNINVYFTINNFNY